MGEMADYYASMYCADLADQHLQEEREDKDFKKIYLKSKPDPFKTENILNRNTWVDGQGTVHELKDMGRDHLQNVLHFLYKQRDRYWLNCNDASLIEKFKDGDQFFQLVIRESTIWKSIINELEKPSEGFNFNFEVPGK